mmetsp:Transcript_15351/g.30598  ORF Transcript_15351/g.30598 Transcript_15351/m.30598 type:complete len:84 (+) Transcript_15351:89-340(+)
MVLQQLMQAATSSCTKVITYCFATNQYFTGEGTTNHSTSTLTRFRQGKTTIAARLYCKRNQQFDQESRRPNHLDWSKRRPTQD